MEVLHCQAPHSSLSPAPNPSQNGNLEELAEAKRKKVIGKSIRSLSEHIPEFEVAPKGHPSRIEMWLNTVKHTVDMFLDFLKLLRKWWKSDPTTYRTYIRDLFDFNGYFELLRLVLNVHSEREKVRNILKLASIRINIGREGFVDLLSHWNTSRNTFLPSLMTLPATSSRNSQSGGSETFPHMQTTFTGKLNDLIAQSNPHGDALTEHTTYSTLRDLLAWVKYTSKLFNFHDASNWSIPDPDKSSKDHGRRKKEKRTA
ncbi:hypothetical protein HK102_004553 [Quaeritorhiza haematococci]|nr:hypothetical protein HK102_004553 [Quaeritorhiza haematococci]